MSAVPERHVLFTFSNREILIARLLPDGTLEHPAWVSYDPSPQGVRMAFIPITLFAEESLTTAEAVRHQAIFEFTPSQELIASYQQLIQQLRAAKSGIAMPQSRPGGIVVPGPSISPANTI